MVLGRTVSSAGGVTLLGEGVTHVQLGFAADVRAVRISFHVAPVDLRESEESVRLLR